MPGEASPNSLTGFIDRVGETSWSVQIINQTAAKPIGNMVDELFNGLEINTTEMDRSEAGDDILALLHDGEVVASSPLSRIRETLLVVNSDLYKTRGKEIQDINPPDIIMELSDTVFRLQGYPKSNTEKLVLTLVSRYIEHQAWTHESGTLQSSFQRLSRINDEQGTRNVYDRLGQVDSLDVHAYGAPDWDPPESIGVTVHGIDDEDIVRHWFVVYNGKETGSAALLAVKTGRSEWKGYWTYDTEEIRSISQYISRYIE